MTNEIVSTKQISEYALSQIDSQKTGLPTGLYELDNKIMGLKNGEYIIVAARPSMGKTSLATDIALSVSDKHKVLFFSIEMNPVTLVQKMLGNLAEISLYTYRSGKMLPSAWDKLKKARYQLEKKLIWFDGSSCLSAMQITNKVAQVNNCELIIIDYIQLMIEAGSGYTSREEEMSSISRQLNAISKDMNVPVIVLSQLNRACLLRPNHKPLLGDLRDSGSLEQDADIVLFIHRPGYYKPDKDDGSTEIIVAKNRTGPTGSINCHFNKELSRFENYKMKDW